ncbi:hypothetical protein M406DRAFT_357236 [Cryphonectria parasitica EP155]|uniref:Uncharacterized protein n=1 Tax=Cryphonectria parasitica (strain ATCC 38755 / EP155) TaxID=660469 RepID=A0A9P5CN63_CRYP1|nr:uncharacterized protein M406DRAFT_357236 [Cryphonectria parasitica EP155]KAF3763806.1 hypothetical protein M406DRAFT_357236 [Cryphonectria parasitica EP155]
MSTPSSIQIPAKVYETRQHCAKEQSPLSSSSSTYSMSPQPPSSATPSKAAQKKKAVHERRPSLLSPAISKSEATTINIGDPDGPPRLISYLSSSQGFAWNPEIFLPSYIDVDYVPLENRREPVVEIIVSDDERRKWFPDGN